MRRLGNKDQFDLLFDLINAISIANDPNKSALLINDLFTAKEIENVSKRLRIAKLILANNTHEEIVDNLHCSYSTVSKVQTWINSKGEGFRSVISKLPKRYTYPKNLPPIPLEFQMPQLINAVMQYKLADIQTKKLEKFASDIQDKEYIDQFWREINKPKYFKSEKKK